MGSTTASPSKPLPPPKSRVFAAGLIGAALALALVGTLALLGGELIARSETTAAAVPRVKDYTKALQVCAGDANGSPRAGGDNFLAFRQLWTLCANQVYFVDLMEDFDIRREKLVRQELDERVILWMVVAITMSGVFLAGLQLLGSYRLAVAGTGKFGDPTQVLVEGGRSSDFRVSVQSSITGLMILVVSLAFFIVYVEWIYTIQEISIEKPQMLNEAATGGHITGVGSLRPAAEQGGAGPGAASPGAASPASAASAASPGPASPASPVPGAK